MSGPPSITPLFATPFALVPAVGDAALNNALSALLLARATEEYRDPAAQADALCFRSREDLYEWPQAPIVQLRDAMLSALCEAVRAVSRYREAEFDALRVSARAQFALVRPDGCIPARSAPMASWCALYCVEAPLPAPQREDSGALRLYALRSGTMFKDAANWNLRDPFGDAHQVWRPVAGSMAVFPASITHEIALNRAAGNLLLVSVRARFAHAGQDAEPPW